MDTRISQSPEQTLALGQELGRTLQPGEVLGLIGDLGAGKTQFAKGVALGLGIAERIASPTFALVNEYRTGRLPCYHLDLYRLETPAQIAGAGLEEYLWQRDGVTLIEWFDRWPASAPQPVRLRRISFHAVSDSVREISFDAAS